MAKPAGVSDEDWAWCRALPKVELHAHLNGSVRDQTLRYELWECSMQVHDKNLTERESNSH